MYDSDFWHDWNLTFYYFALYINRISSNPSILVGLGPLSSENHIPFNEDIIINIKLLLKYELLDRQKKVWNKKYNGRLAVSNTYIQVLHCIHRVITLVFM